MPVINPNGRKQITPSTEATGQRRGQRRQTQLFNHKGVPRYDDLVTARMLEQTPTISLPMNTVKKQATAVDWDIVPTVDDPGTQHEMVADRITEFIHGGFNQNGRTWDNLLKLWINDIVSIDTGVLEMVPTKHRLDHPQQDTKEHWLSEVYPVDGMIMSKNLTERDLIPEPPDPAYYKWGNTPNLTQRFTESSDIIDIVRDQSFIRYSQGSRQKAVPYSRDEIMWVEENPRPRETSAYGFGVVQQVRRWAEILLNQDISNLKHFSQDDYAKGILNIGIENADEIDSFREYWKDEVQGKTDTKLPAVALDDSAEYIPLQDTLKELQYLESQEWYSKLVWMLFGETESEMGLTEDANVSTSEHDSVQVFFNTTKPRLEAIQQSINNEWLPKMRDYWLVDGEVEFQFLFDEHPLIQERVREKRRDDLENGLATPNRVLEAEGKDEVPWGDVPTEAVSAFAREHPEWVMEEWGGVEGVPEPSDPDPGGLFSGRPNSNSDGDDLDKEDTDGSKSNGDTGNLNNGRQQKLKDGLANPKDALRNTREDFADLKQYIDAGTQAIGQVFQEELSNLDLEPVFPEDSQKSVETKQAPGLDSLVDRIDMSDALTNAISGVIADTMAETAEYEQNEIENEIADRVDDPDVDIGIDFDLEDTFAFERMQRMAAADMVTVESTCREKIRKTLTEVYEDGGNVSSATQALQDKISELSDSHARLVARTETLSASRHSSQAIAESSDLIGGKRWRATDDGRERSWHAAMDGVVVTTDDDFTVPKVSTDEGEYQPSDYPRTAYVVGDDQPFRCRCDQEQVLADDLPEDMRELRSWDGVSVDLNITERQYEIKLQEGEKGESFKECWQRLRDKHGRNELVDELNMSQTTVSKWDKQFA